MIGVESDLIKRVAFWRHRTAIWRRNYARVLQENKRLKEELKRKHDPYGTKKSS